jgi:hypothetical protein
MTKKGTVVPSTHLLKTADASEPFVPLDKGTVSGEAWWESEY